MIPALRAAVSVFDALFASGGGALVHYQESGLGLRTNNTLMAKGSD